VVLVVVLVFGTVAAAAWAIRFHRSAFEAVHRPDVDAALTQQVSAVSWRPSRTDAGPVGGDLGSASGPVGQLEAPPALPAEAVSVLGWESFTVLSVLFHEGTALVACRRLGPSQTSRSVAFTDSDQTIVLVLGDDQRAAAALGVFEDWRKRQSPLRLRPIGVPGAIEILDSGRTRIRAPLAQA
jgi:hypothetical protein